MKPYDQATYDRDTLVEHNSIWKWVNGDYGAWDGPVDDWLTSHRIRWFKNVKNRRVCIQAGGNLGLYPSFLSNIFDIVYTFEPDPLNFFCLVNNCQSDNIIKLQAALGDTSRLIQVRRNSMSNVGMHQVDEADIGMIPQFTIDQLNIPMVDAIFLDVEGYEIKVLMGALETIKKHQPVIVAERGRTPEIIDLMELLNYQHQEESISDSIYFPR